MTLRDWQYRERRALCCYLILFVAVLFVGLYVGRARRHRAGWIYRFPGGKRPRQSHGYGVCA